MRYLVTVIFVLILTNIRAQTTDASMFWKKSNKYINFVESETGDLYKTLGHHGPAVENLWVGYRIYFNNTMSVDVLSKFEPRIELRRTKWYGNDSLHNENYGKDNFKVWKTVGLGGLRLWENDATKYLETQTKRTASISKTDTSATINITSLGIPYQNELIDIEVKLTVIDNARHAIIETKVLTGKEVQFATGLVMNEKLRVERTERSMMTWGNYESPAASERFDVGAALVYDTSDFNKFVEEEQQLLLISKPTNYLKYYISSANEKESSNLNSFSAFQKYVNKLIKDLYWSH